MARGHPRDSLPAGELDSDRAPDEVETEAQAPQ